MSHASPLCTKEILLPEFLVAEAELMASAQNKQLTHLPNITTEQMIAWAGIEHAQKVMDSKVVAPHIPQSLGQAYVSVQLTMEDRSWGFIHEAMRRDCLAIGMAPLAAEQAHGMFFRRAMISMLVGQATKELV